jgi:hypothetical protein
MEATPSDDSRWQEIMALRGARDDNLVILPHLTNRDDLTPREASPKTVRFAEALAFEDHWSGITDAKRRQQQNRRAA